jgi:hypothetical protein
MKGFLSFMSVMMLSVFTLSAQTNLSYREWQDGALKAEDFAKRRSSGELIGQVYTGIQTYSGEWEKVSWNLRVKRLKSKTVFDPIRSWVRSDSLTDQAVRYGQLIFDATELSRRQMMNHLTSGPHKPDYHTVVSRYFDVNEARTDEIERVTEEGKNLGELQLQETIIAEELAKTPEISGEIPEYTLRKFAIGAYIGAASQFHLGDYSSHFTPAYGFLWGFNIGIGRSVIYWDMVLGGGSRLNRDIPGRKIGTWYSGNKLMYGEGSFQYAYDVYDGDIFKISPFAGVGVGFMDYDNPDDNAEIQTDEIAGLRLLAGLSVEFKYLRSLYLVGDPVWSSMYGGINEHSLRLKVYVARTSYPHAMSPYSINCSLSFNLLSKYMKP